MIHKAQTPDQTRKNLVSEVFPYKSEMFYLFIARIEDCDQHLDDDFQGSAPYL